MSYIPHCDEGIGKYFLAFYGSKGQSVFGNFWRIDIYFLGKWFESVEHAYQYQKCRYAANMTQSVAEKLFDSEYAKHKKAGRCSGDAAFWAGKSIVGNDQKWRADNYNNMKAPLQVKFKDPYCRKILMDTKDLYLSERTDKDPYWGDGKDGKGQNNLGKLLMEIRGDVQPMPQEYRDWLAKKVTVAQPQGSNQCMNCGKRDKFSGYEFCGISCGREYKQKQASPSIPPCKNCGKLYRTPGHEFCSRSCGMAFTNFIQKGKSMCNYCHVKSVYEDPKTGRIHDYCGRTCAKLAGALS